MTQSGKFVKSVSGDEFMLTLDNEGIELEKGNYVVMIDPVWATDPVSSSPSLATVSDTSYKKVLVDFCSLIEIKV